MRAIEDPIVANVEWTEKRNFELGPAAALHRPCFSSNTADRAGMRTQTAGVYDINRAVGAQGILSRHALAGLFKAVFIAREFVPEAGVPFEVHRLCRPGHAGITGRAGRYAACQSDGRERNNSPVKCASPAPIWLRMDQTRDRASSLRPTSGPLLELSTLAEAEQCIGQQLAPSIT